MSGFAFRQGEPLEDIASGFRGFVVSRSDHLTGCNRYFLQPPVGDDGKFIEGIWLDEPSLKRDPARQRIVLEAVVAGEPPG